MSTFLRDVFADVLDPPRHVGSHGCLLGFAQALGDSCEEWPAFILFVCSVIALS